MKIHCVFWNKMCVYIYIHSIALDRTLASLKGFLIVRYIRCGVISPTIYLVLATWYDHQGHLLAKLADTTWWWSRWNVCIYTMYYLERYVCRTGKPRRYRMMMMISGATAQTGPWPHGFHDSFIVRCGLSAPRSTYSRHPDSTIRDI
jgi:hypothetical protein